MMSTTLGGRSASGGIKDLEFNRQLLKAVDAMAHPAVFIKERRFISGVSCTVQQYVHRIVSIAPVFSMIIQDGWAFFFCIDWV
jgi:hypothetical protein